MHCMMVLRRLFWGAGVCFWGPGFCSKEKMFRSKYSWMVQNSQNILNAFGILDLNPSLFYENLKRMRAKAMKNRMAMRNWLLSCRLI